MKRIAIASVLVAVMAGVPHAQTTIVGHTLEEAIKAHIPPSWTPDVVKPWKHGGKELSWITWHKASGLECAYTINVDERGIIRKDTSKCWKSKRTW
jgi:hypothetical protein